MTSLPNPGETLDRLSGDWWIFQLERGHRYATDDVLTAWTAWQARPEALRLLDLGAGVGSIGLMTLQMLLPEARLTSVEVLPQSVALALQTIAYNGIGHRVDLRRGDLRDPSALAPDETFDLITANPPFLPQGSGWESPHPQRRAARFEIHGDVFDYCRVAASHLAGGGAFCFCHTAADPRPEAAIVEAGLTLLERRDVVLRQGRKPQIALFTCGHQGARRDAPDLCVRELGGQRSDEYVEVLREMKIVE
jgi:tRNA1(Val) A37 N6-methylase TrmN6